MIPFIYRQRQQKTNTLIAQSSPSRYRHAMDVPRDGFDQPVY